MVQNYKQSLIIIASQFRIDLLLLINPVQRKAAFIVWYHLCLQLAINVLQVGI
jgi:hypothetical protein